MAHEPNLKAVVIDRIANRLIPAGGMLIVACVLGILVFLGATALPLFLPARAKAARSVPAAGAGLAVDYVDGAPEPWWVTAEGAWMAGSGGAARVEIPGYAKTSPVAAAQCAVGRFTGILFADGRFALVRVEKAPDGSIRPMVLDEMELSRPAASTIAAGRDEEGHGRVAILRDGRVTVAGPAGLAGAAETPLPMTGVVTVAMTGNGAALAAARESGEVQIWNVADVSEPLLVSTVPAGKSPFTSLAFLLGDETLVGGDARGGLTGWMKVRHVKLTNSGASEARVLGDAVPAGGSAVVVDREHSKHLPADGSVKVGMAGFLYIPARTFPPMAGTIRSLAPSGRNKCFAAADAAGGIAVYHATTERRCLEIPRGTPASLVAFGTTGSELAAWTSGLQSWTLTNPHPDVNVGALLAPIWYENYSAPKFIWQTSSGTQETEPKYSLWPLFAGTLKGTLYALLFSVPIALSAAVYVARFAPQQLRSWVKPSIELMAGIPSVVVGMIAALFLAPLVERSLCAVVVGIFLVVPVFAAVVAAGGRLKLKSRAGIELAGAAVSLLLTVLIAVTIAGLVERAFFHGDLRQWLFEKLHVQYDIRNGFIVGIALGFAVIPVIFTIAEDALAAVPGSLTSAAVALGATRWQTVRHVVIPAAASGLFAAIILGIGRAAGETMIVVMAAGNTPIMDPSPWNGMRTLSAAMAIEIPEAPVGGSLYRVLFLTGLLLFAFTAILNTIAELVGTRLRRKYGRV